MTSTTLEVTDKDSLRARVDHEERLGQLTPGSSSEVQTRSLQWQREHEKWGVAAEYFSSDPEGGANDEAQGFAAARGWWKPTEKVSTHLDHQQTIDGPTGDRTTAGVSYRVLSWLALEAAGTVDADGEAARGGLVFTRGDSEVYLTHWLANRGPASRRTTVLGTRSTLGPSTTAYAEYQWEELAGGGQVTSLVGLQRQWDILPGLRIAGSLESSNVDSGQTQAKRSAFNTSVSWNRGRWKANTRNSVRADESGRQLMQFVSYTQVGYEFNEDLSGLLKFNFSESEDRATGLTEARLEEQTFGLAYRPVAHDRLDALLRYSRLNNQRPLSDAGTGEDLWEVVSIDTTYRIHRSLDWLSKLMTRRLSEQTPELSQHTERHNLVIQRFDINIHKPIDLGVEYRMLGATENEDLNQGWLLEGGWRLHPNFRAGVGYNFTDFSDDLYPQNDYSVRGWFLRLQGVY